ncbi:MAG: CAP domain-containing protein [Bacteroidota bacterium]
MRLLLLSLALIALSCSADISTGDSDILPPAGDPGFEDSPSLTGEDADLNNLALALVNTQRAQGCRCGNQQMPAVPTLRVNSRLFSAAQSHSDDMQAMNDMRHLGSDGTQVGERVTREGYTWRAVGENIARGFTSIEQVVEAWFDSPGHCQNLMSPNFTEIALARTNTFWTQVLAAPR